MNELNASEYKTRRPGAFTYKEATAVLGKIAQGALPTATPGLVQALLDYGADVCLSRRKSTNVLKLMMNKDQEDVRSNLLEEATRNCSDDIFRLLAQNADKIALDKALPIAIVQDSTEKVTILLARGADASALCNQFSQAVERGSDDMVDILLRQSRGACQSCRDKGLIRAAELGHTLKAQILLSKGADVAFDQAAALKAAIHSDNEDMVDVLISCKEIGMQHSHLLDFAVGETYSHKQYRAFRRCLQTGAKGPMTDATLIKAIDHRQHDLVQTLIDHGASVEWQEGAAVISAFKSGEPELLQAILKGKPSESSMIAAIAHTPNLSDVRIAHVMVHLLLSAGLRDESVLGETLIQVLDGKSMAGDEEARLKLAYLLLELGNANVNLHQGRSLGLAVSEGWIDIFNLLLRYRPSVDSLDTALGCAMTLNNSDSRKQILTIVLGIVSNSSDKMHLEATAVASAAKSHRRDILEHLAQSCLSSAGIIAGIRAMISTGEEWLTPSGLGTFQFLLDHGASGPPVDEAFCHAARFMNRDAVELLSMSVDVAVFSKALEGVVSSSQEWHSPDDNNLWLVHSLLEWGACGEPVNLALVKATSAFALGSASETLIDTLLLVADVNFQGGEALKVAIRAGNASLLEKLASSGASRDTMTQAFGEVIITRLSEDTVITLLNTIVKSSTSENTPDFKTTLPNRYPPIVDCLSTHPSSAKVVKRLIDLGCDLEAKFKTRVYSEMEPELATALIWSLSSLEENRRVSTPVLEALIEKADVQFTAVVSKATPLILAAKNRRSDAVKMLLKAKGDSYVRDFYGRSPLLYASREGDIDSVNALLKTKFKPNDGSLHEASRNLHYNVVAALIKAGHDANFPSSQPGHDGRSPLQELAYKSEETQSVTRVELTISTLEKGKADPLRKWRGKNSLFLALDNAQPYIVTQALLDTVMWPLVNREDNLFEVRQKAGACFMSPTVYLEKFNSKATMVRNSRLEQLLRTKNCADRYFAESGAEQPIDAVGIPEHIAKELKKRQDEDLKWRTREFEHQEKLRREWEEAQLKATIDESKHNAWQQHEFEKTAQKVDQSSIIHKNQYYQKLQMTTQEQEALAQKNAIIEQARQREQGDKIYFQQQNISLQQRKNVQSEEAARQRLLMEKRTQELKAKAQRKDLAYRKSMQRLKGR
ncbi:hypothetical protein M434DRAFT_82425 [Hypoxylon sp. CO27-5]|nr:hypothetical protein M434DRAFT_82425 [Hypoxylon sp. CO27-5]